MLVSYLLLGTLLIGTDWWLVTHWPAVAVASRLLVVMNSMDVRIGRLSALFVLGVMSLYNVVHVLVLMGITCLGVVGLVG